MNRDESSAVHSVLLVEGTDESHVIRRLCDRSEPMPAFRVEDKGGIEPLLLSIYPEVRAPERSALGILVDANDDPKARWQAVTGRLRQAGVEPPAKPDPSGNIIEGPPRVGIWMMPDNAHPGELEDFVATMIPGGDAIWPLSQSYVEGIPDADRKFTPAKTRRAQIHAWLAVREDPRRMGQAITTGDLDADSETCQRFVRWLRALFKE